MSTKNITREEILSLLGIGPDPKHSFLWYKKNYPDLRKIAQNLISQELDKEGVFPFEAKNLNLQERCIKFPWILLKDHSEMRVLTHDTDHARVADDIHFKNSQEAINFFIDKTYTAGGSFFSKT